tara:strand:+ start:301 stop:486 length:186 start_codon:yes stop_codon:yes gene_type:complete
MQLSTEEKPQVNWMEVQRRWCESKGLDPEKFTPRYPIPFLERLMKWDGRRELEMPRSMLSQ